MLVAPPGGEHNQPLRRAVRQLVVDGAREPKSLLAVAVPDYVRFGLTSTMQLFRSLTSFPSVQRLLALEVPTLAVIGSLDPLLPEPPLLQAVARATENSVLFVVIEGAAHAINFSHPDELANVIRQFMADEPIADDPDAPGHARTYEIHRGARLATGV